MGKEEERIAKLSDAEKKVAEAEHHVARQRRIVETLTLGERDTSAAKELLRQFEEAHATQVVGRDLIRQEIDNPSAKSDPEGS